MRSCTAMVATLLIASLIASVAKAADPIVTNLSLVATSGEPGQLSHRIRRFLVTGYDADGPVTEAIETGCTLNFRPDVAGDDIDVSLRLACALLETPVGVTTIATPRGRRLVQEVALDRFEVEIDFTAEDGETRPIDQPGIPLILATVRRVDDAAAATPQVALDIRMLAGEAEAPGVSQINADLRLVADSGKEGQLSDRTERHFLRGFEAGNPVTGVVSTGCQQRAVPIALSNGHRATTLEFGCTTLDEPIASFEVRTASGPQHVEQPILRTLSLSTQIESPDGVPMPMARVQEGGQEALALLTVSVTEGTPLVDPLLVESQLLRTGAETPSADGATYLAELNVQSIRGETGLLRDLTKRFFVTGLGEQGPETMTLVSGCELEVQTASPGSDPSELSLAVDVGCGAIEAAVRVTELRTPNGSQALQLPVLHRLELSTTATLGDGTTSVLGGLLANDNEEALLLITPRLQRDTPDPGAVSTAARIASVAREGAEALLGAPPARVLEEPSLTIADGATGILSDLTERSFVAHTGPVGPLTDRVHGGCVFQVEPTLEGDAGAQHVLATVSLGCESIELPIGTFEVATPQGLQRIQLPTVHGLHARSRVAVGDGQTVVLGGLLSETPTVGSELPVRERQESIVLLTSNLVRDDSETPQVHVEARLASTSEGAAESETGMAGPTGLHEVALVTRPERQSVIEEFSAGFFVGDFGPDGPIVTAEDSGCALVTAATPLGDPDDGRLRLASHVSCRSLDEAVDTFEVSTLEGKRNVPLPVVHTLSVNSTVDVGDGQTLVLGGLLSDDEEAVVFVTPRRIAAEPGSLVHVAARLVRAGVDGQPSRESFAVQVRKEAALSTPLGVPATLSDFMTEDVAVRDNRGQPLVVPWRVGFELTLMPTLLGTGAIAVNLQFLCDAVDEDARPTANRPKPLIDQPFAHALMLDTTFEAVSGETVAIGSSLNGGELLILVTPRLVPSPAPSAPDEVLLELRLQRITHHPLGAAG